MRKTIGILILALVSSVALALPAPKDIEAAVQAGHLTQAETMLHEVIEAKPGSAKAHYELGQVLARQGRNDAARRELLEAERLDPSLAFATDPLQFRNLVNRVSTVGSPAVTRPAAAARVAAPAQPPAAASFPFGYLLVGGGLIVVIAFLIARAMAAPARAPAPAGGTLSAGGFGNSGGYGPGYGPGSVPANSGSGIGGAVLGGVAGLAAGYGLAKMLDGRESGGHSTALNDSGYVPIDDPAPADFGAFDAGSGSDWDDSSASADVSSGDDNW